MEFESVDPLDETVGKIIRQLMASLCEPKTQEYQGG
jgi:hypothetical protein